MKNRLLLLIFFLILFAPMVVSAEVHMIDKTRWYDCMDKSECMALSDSFRDQIKRSGYKTEQAYAVVLSALLAEVLRPEGEAIDLNVTHEAGSFLDTSKSRALTILVRAMLAFLFEGGDKAREHLDLGMSGLISSDVITVLSFKNDHAVFQRYADAVMKKNFLMPVAYQLAESYRKSDLCAQAKDYYRKLMGKRKKNSYLVSSWARAEMDCNGHSPNIYKRLAKIYKKNPDDLRVRAEMIRYQTIGLNFKKIAELTYGLEPASLKGLAGSDLLVEWGWAKMNEHDIKAAEMLFNRAVEINPKNERAYYNLGMIFMVTENRNLPKAIAAFKSYLYLTPKTYRHWQIESRVKRLEAELGN